MELRIILMEVYNGCIPVTVYMVQKYVGGFLFGMKEEGHGKYWHRGSIVRWWTHERHKQKKHVRKHPECVIWI